MKFSKEFSRTANADGQLVYRRKQNVALPVRLIRTSATLEPGSSDSSLDFAIFMDDALLAQGNGAGDQPLRLEPNTRVSRGQREFRFVANGFQPHQAVSGVVEIEFSFF
ncbi:MAG: hypothetical protein H0T75_08915 [Rhizobiales bacterium]|jgi:hypothetical protein|nr:hypothetical protein [Hyphomicrobiales bacterium]